MIIQAQVGPSTAGTLSIGAGTQSVLRLGNMGDLIQSELHGRYYETTYRRAGFSAANPTGQTATALVSGTTTVFVGFGLTNPLNSGVNIVINKVGYACVVAPASEAIIALAVGYNGASPVTQTTPLTVRNNYVGLGAAGQGLAAASFTFPTAPNVQTVLGTLGTGAATVSITTGLVIDMEGSVILPPGGYACVASLVAAGASGAFASMSWEEIPL